MRQHTWVVKARDADAERAICSRCGISRFKVRQTDRFPSVTYRDQGGQVWRNTRPECKSELV